MKKYIVRIVFKNQINDKVMMIKAKDGFDLEDKVNNFVEPMLSDMLGYEYDQAKFKQDYNILCGPWIGAETIPEYMAARKAMGK